MHGELYVMHSTLTTGLAWPLTTSTVTSHSQMYHSRIWCRHMPQTSGAREPQNGMTGLQFMKCKN